MKKFISIAIAGLLSISIVGCSNKESNKEETKENASTVSQDNKTIENNCNIYEQLISMKESDSKLFNVQKTPYGGQIITGYTGKEDLIKIPEEIDGIPVTEIRDGTFANNNSPKGIILGKNIKIIYDSSFANNDILEVFISQGLEKIDKTAFLNCKVLKEVHLNDGLKEIESLAFAGTKLLEEIAIPDSVKTIQKDGLFHFSNKNLIIKGTKNSLAKELAEANELKYEEIK